jgi:hypothetical protein
MSEAAAGERAWRVVLRGRMTDEMVRRLRVAGIFPRGAPSDSGNVDRAGNHLIDHALLVVAADADQAYVRVGEALGDQFGGRIIETPTPWEA